MLQSKIKTKDGYDYITAYSVEEFNPQECNYKFDRVMRHNKTVSFATEYITLDTETSKIDLNDVDEKIQMYNWLLVQFSENTKGQIIRVDNDDLIALRGLTVSEYNKKLSILGKNHLKISKNKGSYIDSIWSEIVVASNYELSDDINNKYDMLVALDEYIDMLLGGYIEERKMCGWVYQWAMNCNGVYVYGRKPSGIIAILEKLKDYYKLTDKKRILLFIHNLSYDLQYIKHFLKEYDNNISMFAIDNHTILCVEVCGFRILCSYEMTNLSLDVLSDKYSKKYIKAVGAIDYNIVHFQDEELLDDNWYYQFSDVASQYDGIRQYTISNGYERIYNIPMTSTGFVRDEVRKASKKTDWWKEFRRIKLTYSQYQLCRQAFQGGVTICSWQYSGITLRDGDILSDGRVVRLGHKDFKSSYPARQLIDYMPIGKPTDYGDIEDIEELEYLINEYCVVFIMSLENVHIRSGITAPYISSSKCLIIDKPLKINGKVVYANKLTMVVTEIDFNIINRQYTYDNLYCTNAIIFERGKLPIWFRDEVYKYFYDKCTLDKQDILYMKQKNRLNGIFGMTATAIIRDLYSLNDGLYIDKEKLTDEQKRTQLNKYYKNFNSFMPYQWSIYTTAHARRALYDMIEAVGYDCFLYCDTDSVFYIETDDNIKRLELLNEKLKRQAIDNNAYVGNNYLGYMDDEEHLRAFRALHSKCYAMEEWSDKKSDYDLKVVVAGISKSTIVWNNGESHIITSAEELGDIDNLKDGFIFKYNGGIRAIYIEDDIHTIDIDGHKTELSSSCILENIEKTISDTMWTKGDKGELLRIVQYAQK